MLKSLALLAGNTIGIVSTARWITEEELQQGENIFHQWGFHTKRGPSALFRDNQFAGTDDDRRKDLQTFLDDPNIDAIVCSRGGYGTIRLLNELDFTMFMAHPKLLCGFSDITVLHTLINDKLGLPSIHSTMPGSFATNTPEALASLKNALLGKPTAFHVEPHPLNIQGQGDGMLIGGNLSLLYSLLGTKFGFSTKGKILFIEDVDELLYHIDRMMMSMHLAGKLDNLKGVIVGGMSEMKDNIVPFGKNAEEIIVSYFNKKDIPILFGFPAGHISDNRALLFGRKVKIIVSSSGGAFQYSE